MPRGIGFIVCAGAGSLLGCSESEGHAPDIQQQPDTPSTAATELVLGDLPTPEPSFKRGINLGNRLDVPHEGDHLGLVLHESDFPQAAEHGFDHVRLPVKFSARAGASPPYAIDA